MRCAVVTGGSKGIGLEIVKNLLERGYSVIANYSSDDSQAEKVRHELQKYGERFSLVKASQSDREEFKCFTTYIRSKFEKIDCIVCNAGATLRKNTFDIADEEWQAVFDVSLNSHFFLIRDLHDIIGNDARIIFIGSMMGVYPHATSLPYGVSKAAVHALARNLVKDFEGSGTTVNAIVPGFVETEWQKSKPQAIRDSINRKTACGRFATPAEIVSAVDFCLDNAFVNGSLIEISGGYCFK